MHANSPPWLHSLGRNRSPKRSSSSPRLAMRRPPAGRKHDVDIHGTPNLPMSEPQPGDQNGSPDGAAVFPPSGSWSDQRRPRLCRSCGSRAKAVLWLVGIARSRNAHAGVRQGLLADLKPAMQQPGFYISSAMEILSGADKAGAGFKLPASVSRDRPQQDHLGDFVVRVYRILHHIGSDIVGADRQPRRRRSLAPGTRGVGDHDRHAAFEDRLQDRALRQVAPWQRRRAAAAARWGDHATNDRFHEAQRGRGQAVLRVRAAHAGAPADDAASRLQG